jgi:hypothetical protein
VAEGAADAASKGQSIRALMQDAHEKQSQKRRDHKENCQAAHRRLVEIGLKAKGK